MLIAKFGGTSVKTVTAIRHVANIIRNNPAIRLVVVSAVGGATNLLVQLCNASQSLRRPLLDQFTNIHLALARDLNITITTALTEFLRTLATLAMQELLTPQQIDNILAFGEDLSSLLIQQFLQTQHIPATAIDSRDYLITNNHFGKAEPNLKAIRTRATTLPAGLCIMQGFVGATPQRETTTLGRGGSDYTAALMAEALSAQELQIYTDVPGVYTSDPNIIANATVIPHLSFQEMAEMANFGAKILHPATLEPCLRANIPARILSTFQPNSNGTSISKTKSTNNTSDKTSKVSAITLRQGQVLVTIKSLKMINARGFLATIFSILAQHNISVDLITTSEASVALTVDPSCAQVTGEHPFTTNSILYETLRQFADISIEEDLTLIAIVGSGLTIPGLIQRALGVIQPHRIRLVCYGASHSNIGILVHKDHAIDMATTLHQQLLPPTHSINNPKEIHHESQNILDVA